MLRVTIITGRQGLDKVNIWSQSQYIRGGSDKGWGVINSEIEKGVTPSANKSSFIWWADKNNTYLGRICSRVYADGATILWLSALNYYKNGALDPTGSSITTSLILGVDANGYKSVQTNADFRPDVNNTFNLGTSTNKWKTLNGINPGALSLPAAGAEIDRTNWVYDGVTENTYTPTVDGWVLVRCADVVGDFIFIASDGKIASTSGTGVITSVTFGLNVLLPVRASKMCSIKIKCSGSRTAYFFPCLGNV